MVLHETMNLYETGAVSKVHLPYTLVFHYEFWPTSKNTLIVKIHYPKHYRIILIIQDPLSHVGYVDIFLL